MNLAFFTQRTTMCLRRSVPIEPKTGNIWPKFCHPTNDLFYVARLGVSATLQLTTSFTWLVLEYLPRSNQRLVLRGSSWSICHGLVLGCIDADFLQVNMRWKALDEIYKIYMLLHRSDLNISENFRKKISQFVAKFKFKFCKNSLFLNSCG